MKIGIDARVLQGVRRGQGQYVYYLVKNLIEIDKKNEYFLFYNGFNKKEFVFEENAPNLRQVWCRIPGTVLGLSWPAVSFPPVELFTGSTDVFHNTINFNFTHYTPIPCRGKMVATFHGMTDPADIWGKYDLKRINRWFNIIAERASKIIVVSKSVKEDLLSRIDIPQEKIKVVYCGVGEEFKPENEKSSVDAVLSKYGLSGKRYILYVGAAEKNKNIKGLLEAFLKIRNNSRFKDVYLVLAGKIDPDYRKLIEYSKTLGIEQKVIFTDYIEHSDLPMVYNGAEVFILPTFNEWFGIPLLEAMSCGVPVAASNCRGIPEVVGDAGILFNPHNIEEMSKVLSGVLENKPLQLELKEKGFKRARDFSWKKTAENTLEVYLEAAGK